MNEPVLIVFLEKGFSPEARAAALEARRAKMKGKDIKTKRLEFVKNTIKNLSEKLKIPEPELSFSRRVGDRFENDGVRREIILTRNHIHNPDQLRMLSTDTAALHEFAHYATDLKEAEAKSKFEKKGGKDWKRWDDHGPEFANNLVEVAEAHYGKGKAGDYKWDEEYAPVRTQGLSIIDPKKKEKWDEVYWNDEVAENRDRRWNLIFPKKK